METYSNTSNGQTRIWDVTRLIKLASALPTIQIPVATIRELDQEMWFGGPRNVRPTCREVVGHVRRIQEANLAHPIILSADGRVMDGMHRIAKALMEGRTHIDAKRFDIDPTPDRTQ
jgi:hypothetical protein